MSTIAFALLVAVQGPFHAGLSLNGPALRLNGRPEEVKPMGIPSKKSADSGKYFQEFPPGDRSAATSGPGWSKLPSYATAAEIALSGSRLGARLPSSGTRLHASRNSRTLRFYCRHVAATLSIHSTNRLPAGLSVPAADCPSALRLRFGRCLALCNKNPRL